MEVSVFTPRCKPPLTPAMIVLLMGPMSQGPLPSPRDQEVYPLQLLPIAVVESASPVSGNFIRLHHVAKARDNISPWVTFPARPLQQDSGSEEGPRGVGRTGDVRICQAEAGWLDCWHSVWEHSHLIVGCQEKKKRAGARGQSGKAVEDYRSPDTSN